MYEQKEENVLVRAKYKYLLCDKKVIQKYNRMCEHFTSLGSEFMS